MPQNISPQSDTRESGFAQMPLSDAVKSAVSAAGYETPTPIQANAIPVLVAGKDIIGQARTGTGKTAAFALPLLSRIDLDTPKPQVLVLTPTRELAIQVAQAFETYARQMKGLKVLAVYGGQSYGVQLNALKKGVHVIVGTPGRIMDHIQRKTLSLASLFCKVLDEADEMLHMGFIDDVEWIFDQIPEKTQTALFSATMPPAIRRMSQKYLDAPEEITMKAETSGVENISQQFWLVKGCSKSVGLVRFLDATTFDGVIIFVKTKASTLDVSRVLEEHGFRSEALNGDMAQAAREKTVSQMKAKRIDILVATDVAARGLDLDRISHVINYDMPGKSEPYVHRIGRTGRAGRTGDAISFLYPKEKWMIRRLEQATGHRMKEIQLPTNKAINKKRVADFKAAIATTLENQDLSVFEEVITEYANETGTPITAVAAALGKLVHGDAPFLLKKDAPGPKSDKKDKFSDDRAHAKTADKKAARKKDKKSDAPIPLHRDRKTQERIEELSPLKKGMDRYRIEVGRSHGVKARDIVGAISNEAGLESKYIVGVTIKKEFSVVDLPAGMPQDIFHVLKKTWVRSRPMDISKVA